MMDRLVRISYHEELAEASSDPIEKARHELAAQMYKDMLQGAEQATSPDYPHRARPL